MASSSLLKTYTIANKLISSSSIPSLLPFLAPAIFTRNASKSTKKKKTPKASGKGETKVKKKLSPNFKREPMRLATTFSLCDAMRYLRAFEVGHNPTSPKYDLAISFQTSRNGYVIRNQVKLPHGFGQVARVAVICPPDSEVAQEAREAGAILVGEDVIFNQIQEGVINFDRLYCHPDSLQKLQQANLGRILGPKGLMPNEKNKTIITDVKSSLQSGAGGVDYRERSGVVRLAIGQLGFTPKQMQENIKAFMANLKKDVERAQERVDKEIHEVVLSSTHGPGFPLSRQFETEDGIKPEQLTIF